MALKSARWLLWVICSPSTETVPWLPPAAKSYANRWITQLAAIILNPFRDRRRFVQRSAPGPVDTPLLSFKTMPPGLQTLETSNPLGRIGRSGEVAAVIILFLAGPAARFITGQCCAAGGGEAITMEERP